MKDDSLAFEQDAKEHKCESINRDRQDLAYGEGAESIGRRGAEEMSEEDNPDPRPEKTKTNREREVLG